jgi:hypothetical protein
MEAPLGHVMGYITTRLRCPRRSVACQQKKSYTVIVTLQLGASHLFPITASRADEARLVFLYSKFEPASESAEGHFKLCGLLQERKRSRILFRRAPLSSTV